MNTVTIQMPDSLASQLREAVATSGLTLDQFLNSAAAEKLSAWQTVDHLRERAVRARREDFIAFLDQSPDIPPLPGDEMNGRVVEFHDPWPIAEEAQKSSSS